MEGWQHALCTQRKKRNAGARASRVDVPRRLDAVISPLTLALRMTTANPRVALTTHSRCGQTVQGTHAGFRTVGERAGQNLSPLARLATQRSTSTHAFSAVDRDAITFRNNRRFNISPFAFVGVILDLAHDGVMYVNHTPRPGHRHLQGTVGRFHSLRACNAEGVEPRVHPRRPPLDPSATCGGTRATRLKTAKGSGASPNETAKKATNKSNSEVTLAA